MENTNIKIRSLEFIKTMYNNDDDILWTHKSDYGIISILDRLTRGGKGNIRDIETGYKDTDNKFWLVSGNFDIRRYGDLSISEAIDKIKQNANTCVGI